MRKLRPWVERRRPADSLQPIIVRSDLIGEVNGWQVVGLQEPQQRAHRVCSFGDSKVAVEDHDSRAAKKHFCDCFGDSRYDLCMKAGLGEHPRDPLPHRRSICNDNDPGAASGVHR
jgi:hypothetical protein